MALGVGYFYVYNFHSIGLGIGHCPFKSVVGIPCPGCGGISSTYAMIHGDWWTSLVINPLSIFVNLFMVISAAWLIRDAVVSKDSYFKFLKERRLGRLTSVVIVLIVVVFWGINIWRHFN